MNPNTHGQARRNSSTFNRQGNPGRSNHNHNRWTNRYNKDYGREYDNSFNRGECSMNVQNNGVPIDNNYVNGYPKTQVSPVLRNNNNIHYSGNDASAGHVQDRRPNQVERRPNYASDHMHMNQADGRRALHINTCDNATAQNDHQRPPLMDFSNNRQMRRDLPPLNLQQPPAATATTYFNRQTSDEAFKSESPSRKRRRLSSRSSNQHEVSAQAAPPQRATPPASHVMQGSPPLRRPPRYRERNDLINHTNFIANANPPQIIHAANPQPHIHHMHHPHMHPHQSTSIMMDMNHQLPVTIPIHSHHHHHHHHHHHEHPHLWSYTAQPHISLCSAPPGAPPHMHSCHVYPTQLLPQQFITQNYANAITTNHYQHLTQQRPDTIEMLNQHVPTLQLPPPLFLGAEARSAQLELLHARTRPARLTPPQPTQRTRWHHHNGPPLLPAPPPPQYSGFLLHFLAMFSNPPLSSFNHATDLNNGDSVGVSEAEHNYEALLNLAERLGEAKMRGLAKTEIEQLLIYKFDADTHDDNQTSCVVCMCDFEPRQLIRVLPCSHEFHSKCVDKWLRTNSTCPICRGNAAKYFNPNV